MSSSGPMSLHFFAAISLSEKNKKAMTPEIKDNIDGLLLLIEEIRLTS